MSSIASAPGARRLFVISILARLPLVMLSIGLLVHAQRLTGSFAAAGARHRRLRGRARRRRPAARPARRPPRPDAPSCSRARRRGRAARSRSRCCPPARRWRSWSRSRPAIGLATPPRRRLPAHAAARAAPRRRRVRAAYALEASASELTWIAGPPLALGLGALWSTGAALALAGPRCSSRPPPSRAARLARAGARRRPTRRARAAARWARPRCGRSCSC